MGMSVEQRLIDAALFKRIDPPSSKYVRFEALDGQSASIYVNDSDKDSRFAFNRETLHNSNLPRDKQLLKYARRHESEGEGNKKDYTLAGEHVDNVIAIVGGKSGDMSLPASNQDL